MCNRVQRYGILLYRCVTRTSSGPPDPRAISLSAANAHTESGEGGAALAVNGSAKPRLSRCRRLGKPAMLMSRGCVRLSRLSLEQQQRGERGQARRDRRRNNESTAQRPNDSTLQRRNKQPHVARPLLFPANLLSVGRSVWQRRR